MHRIVSISILVGTMLTIRVRLGISASFREGRVSSLSLFIIVPSLRFALVLCLSEMSIALSH